MRQGNKSVLEPSAGDGAIVGRSYHTQTRSPQSRLTVGLVLNT